MVGGSFARLDSILRTINESRLTTCCCLRRVIPTYIYSIIQREKTSERRLLLRGKSTACAHSSNQSKANRRHMLSLVGACTRFYDVLSDNQCEKQQQSAGSPCVAACVDSTALHRPPLARCLLRNALPRLRCRSCPAPLSFATASRSLPLRSFLLQAKIKKKKKN